MSQNEAEPKNLVALGWKPAPTWIMMMISKDKGKIFSEKIADV